MEYVMSTVYSKERQLAATVTTFYQESRKYPELYQIKQLY